MFLEILALLVKFSFVRSNYVGYTPALEENCQNLDESRALLTDCFCYDEGVNDFEYQICKDVQAGISSFKQRTLRQIQLLTSNYLHKLTT